MATASGKVTTNKSDKIVRYRWIWIYFLNYHSFRLRLFLLRIRRLGFPSESRGISRQINNPRERDRCVCDVSFLLTGLSTKNHRVFTFPPTCLCRCVVVALFKLHKTRIYNPPQNDTSVLLRRYFFFVGWWKNEEICLHIIKLTMIIYISGISENPQQELIAAE